MRWRWRGRLAWVAAVPAATASGARRLGRRAHAMAEKATRTPPGDNPPPSAVRGAAVQGTDPASTGGVGRQPVATLGARAWVLAAILVLLMAGCGGSPPTGTASQPAGAPPAAQLDRLLAGAVAQPGGPPGVIGYLAGPGGVWQAAVGLANLATRQPMAAIMRYRIGSSTTKTFTAVVVLQLVQEDLLGLDDPIASYLPGVLPYRQPITVRQLLNHTAGTFDYRQAAGNPDPFADIPRITDPTLRRQAQQLATRARTGEAVLATPRLAVAAAATHPLAYTPGQGFNYSNTDYQLLTLLIQRLTHQPLATVYQQRILGPLGLRDTDLPADRTITGAHPHAYTPDEHTGALVDSTADVGLGVWGDGGLVSTAADLASFYQALLGGRLLAPPLLHQLLQPAPNSALGSFASGYGLGIEHLRTPCGLDAWGHGGDLAGFKTAVIATRDGRYVTVLAQNLASGDTETIRNRVAPRLLCTAWQAGQEGR
jgi:D-alanyl-D-alanine carboxypeptidase